MVEKGDKKVQVILFLILVMGLLFLSKAFFLRHNRFLSDQHQARPVASQGDLEDQLIVSNVFLDHWDPPYGFIQNYEPLGFWVESVVNNGEDYILQITRRTAAYSVELAKRGQLLFTENGEICWNIPRQVATNQKYYALPQIYGVNTIQEAKDVIERISGQSSLFKNYLSSVDAKEKIFYLRNGNVLLVNSWGYLDVFDGEAFIYQMGKGQIYDLYSNGRYFPIIKRGE